MQHTYSCYLASSLSGANMLFSKFRDNYMLIKKKKLCDNDKLLNCGERIVWANL